MGEYMKRSECISREAAISKIRDQGVLGGDYDAYEREEDVVDTLNSIPAADVVEVRHGRWIKFSRGDVCSECQYQTGRYEHGGNYCPHCGAKMDGGKGNAE